MKKLLHTFLILLATIYIARADNSSFLFDEFKPAQLVSIDFRQFKADVNYSFVLNKFVFKDTHDNNVVKEIDPVMEIVSIKIDDRVFSISEKGIVKEILQQTPFISVQYKGRTKPAGKEAGYDGKSETSATDSYGYLYSNKGGPMLKLKVNESVLISIDLIYEIDRSGKSKTFMFPGKFIKFYPKEIREELEAYINDQNIDFKKTDQVISLYNFAESLAQK